MRQRGLDVYGLRQHVCGIGASNHFQAQDFCQKPRHPRLLRDRSVGRPECCRDGNVAELSKKNGFYDASLGEMLVPCQVAPESVPSTGRTPKPKRSRAKSAKRVHLLGRCLSLVSLTRNASEFPQRAMLQPLNLMCGRLASGCCRAE